MRRVAFLAIALLVLSSAVVADSGFDQHFTGDTMRLDYFHTGTAEFEHLSLDRARIEGPWPGSRTKLLDDTNLGKYRFEVVDIASNQVLYSRGFASIFGEWETTGEARKMNRTFHESVRFPNQEKTFELVLKKRDSQHVFREVWRIEIDPNDYLVHRPGTPVPS